jgi:hypothetical protein
MNVYLVGLLQYIFFHFYLFICFNDIAGLVVHACFFASPLISYFVVVVVVVFFLLLLQFAHLGLCNRDWNYVIPGGLVVAFFFVRCVLLIVV